MAIRDEFRVHILNERGLQTVAALAEIFSDTLNRIETRIPAGRERALVITKLQEAAFFAKRAIAADPLNQVDALTQAPQPRDLPL